MIQNSKCKVQNQLPAGPLRRASEASRQKSYNPKLKIMEKEIETRSKGNQWIGKDIIS